MPWIRKSDKEWKWEEEKIDDLPLSAESKERLKKDLQRIEEMKKGIWMTDFFHD